MKAATLPPDYRKSVKWSLALHGAFILFVLIKGLVFPGKALTYAPTLRVDLVGLPDVLKKDLTQLPKASAEPEHEATPAQKIAKKEAAPLKKAVVPAAPDEMVLHPKQASDSAKKKLEREKRLKGSLDRIKALARLANDEAPAKAAVVKGNMISKGSSLSGDAKERSEANYLDDIRAKLQDNWELPPWIARQKLSAQVQIYIDSHGKLRSFKFVKLSGNKQFDDAVKETLHKSQPYPAPPESLASSLLVDGVLIGFPL